MEIKYWLFNANKKKRRKQKKEGEINQKQVFLQSSIFGVIK